MCVDLAQTEVQDFPRIEKKNLLQGELNPGLPGESQVSYPLDHKGCYMGMVENINIYKRLISTDKNM